MTNLGPSNQARRVQRARWCALAWWPFIAALACNTYDSGLVGDVSTPLGGSDAEGGTGATTSAGMAGGGAASAGNNASGGEAGSTGAAPSGGMAGETASTGGSAGVTTMGGNAGKSSTGGAGGSAGTAMAGSGGTPAAEDSDPIDDMEDGDAQVELAGGRNGYWYVGSDGTVGATTDPMGAFAMSGLTKGDHGDSMWAAHLKAVNFTGWGSVMGFNVVEQAGTVKAYDASAYCGIQFWAKAAATTTVRFRLPDGDTHQSGGVCTGTGNQACYDHFGAFAQLTTTWKAFPVKFSELTQLGTGYHPADGKLKADKLYAVEWALPGGAAKTYEIWIDDVEFIKCK
jgi:hypothetical protein